jgi:hypothetical protein
MNTQGLAFETEVPDEQEISCQMCGWDAWGTSGDVQLLNLETNIDMAFRGFYQRALRIYRGSGQFGYDVSCFYGTHEHEDSNVLEQESLALSNWASAYRKMYGNIVAPNVVKFEQTFSTYPIREMATLESLYNLRDRPEVVTFVACNLFLIPLLQQVPEQVKRHFGESASLSLRVIIDQEESNNKELVVFVGTDFPPSEAFESLRAFDRDWWLSVLPETRNMLLIDVEFT